MVRKKIAGVVVGIVFLAGNCLASAPEEQPEGGKVERSKVLASKFLKRKMFARGKVAASRPQAGKSLTNKIVVELRKGLNMDEIVAKIDELSTLKERIDELSQKIDKNQESRERDRAIIFKSAKDVKQYMEDNKGGIDEGDLTVCIDRTLEYFQNDGLNRVPAKVPQDEWPRAKIIEIFSEIVKNVQDLELMDDIISRCRDEIKNKSENSKFKEMRLLLMSQCKVWNEETKKYKLQTGRDVEVVRRAFKLLYAIMSRKQNEDDAESARRLLRSMNTNKEMVPFFPPEYF
jgi:hypothetical protein